MHRPQKVVFGISDVIFVVLVYVLEWVLAFVEFGLRHCQVAMHPPLCSLDIVSPLVHSLEAAPADDKVYNWDGDREMADVLCQMFSRYGQIELQEVRKQPMQQTDGSMIS